jgi:hypothetical protein
MGKGNGNNIPVQKGVETKDWFMQSVKRIKVYKRETPEGETQREAFRIRWGKNPEQL